MEFCLNCNQHVRPKDEYKKAVFIVLLSIGIILIVCGALVASPMTGGVGAMFLLACVLYVVLRGLKDSCPCVGF